MEMFAECPECGQTFKKKCWQHTFCSYECKYKHTFVSTAVHEERKCLNCGKSFMTSSSRPLFCGRKCSKEYYNREHYGVHSDWIRRGNNHGSEIGYTNKVQTKYSQFEYAGGWENDKAYFICKDCGCIFKHGTKELRPSETRKMSCPNCLKILSSVRIKEKNEKKQIEQERMKLRKIEKPTSGVQIMMGFCEVCGNVFIPKRKNARYCSEKCFKSNTYKIKEAYRYVIPLETLAERDNNVCQICGEKVDWNDKYVNTDGFVVYGNRYPSRDHIIPKAKGGGHTWQNMQLAHRICNSKKWANKLTKTS